MKFQCLDDVVFLEVHFILLPISAEHIVPFAWLCESDAGKVRKQIVVAQCVGHQSSEGQCGTAL